MTCNALINKYSSVFCKEEARHQRAYSAQLVELKRVIVGITGKKHQRRICDENQQALKDPLHILVRPITRARSKKVKEALNGLIQEIWIGHSKLGPKKMKA